MKKEKSTSGLPFLATVVLLIVAFLLIFISYTYVFDGVTDNGVQNPAEDSGQDKKLDIVFFKELEIVLGAIILTIAAVFILLILRHKQII